MTVTHVLIPLRQARYALDQRVAGHVLKHPHRFFDRCRSGVRRTPVCHDFPQNSEPIEIKMTAIRTENATAKRTFSFWYSVMLSPQRQGGKNANRHNESPRQAVIHAKEKAEKYEDHGVRHRALILIANRNGSIP